MRVNDAIRAAADRHGFRLVDLYDAPSMTEPDTWSADRVHGSPKGHTLFAAAAAEALGLPGSNHDWAEVCGGRRAAVAAVDGVLAGALDAELAHAVAVASRARPVRRRRRGPRRPRLEGVAA